NYRISDYHNAYFRYAKGFRIPDEGDLYVLAPNQAEFTLEPELLDSYEVGYRGYLSDSVSFNAAVYHMVAEGGIVTGVESPAGNISVNGGEEEYQGVELGLEAQLNEEWAITVAASQMLNRVTQKFANESSPVDGLRLVGSPDNLGNIRLNYQPRIINGLQAELEVQHVGEWYMNETNTTTKEAEQIVNLRLDYAMSSGVSFNAKVLNLLDDDFVNSASAPVWAPTGVFRPGNPRLMSVGVAYSF
ncbi:MAG: TonB-dependent receptor, partial [Pseudomonadales bacterium]|nr:TonB-dependent receptor [Pseudomonadales bacterium]